MPPVVSFKNVSVHFPIYGMGARSLKKNILNFATGGLMKSENSRTVVVEALSQLTIDLHEGDRVGLVGHNGAGKSTFLRVVSGIYEPTLGEVEVRGRPSCLLDIGVGAEGEATGYENIRLRGMLAGMSVAEVDEHTAEIAEFSGLGDYLKMPLRTYSSGMLMRLAFSVATCGHHEVLVMDEWLSTGDKEFKTKAQQRLKQMVNDAKLVLVASHDASLLRGVCNKAIVLQHGKLVDFDTAENIVARYLN